MLHMTKTVLGGLAALGFLLGTPEASAQQGEPAWEPPSKQMPEMPTSGALGGEWQSSLGPWFRGIERVAGASAAELRARGDAKPGSERTQVVRFSKGPMPVVVWTDYNGDERADRIEIYRGTGVVIQLIDADYDGQANVMRIYDGSGELLRERRM